MVRPGRASLEVIPGFGYRNRMKHEHRPDRLRVWRGGSPWRLGPRRPRSRSGRTRARSAAVVSDDVLPSAASLAMRRRPSRHRRHGGLGKTYATKGLVERLLQTGARIAVVDPLGVWWGLRPSPTAPRRASPVDGLWRPACRVPLTAGMGDALGRRIAARALACVVDLSDLGSARAAALHGRVYRGTRRSKQEPLHLVLTKPISGRDSGRSTAAMASWGIRGDRAPGPGVWLRPVADHPASGGAAQGRAEPSRHPGLDKTDGQPGPSGHRALDRGSGLPAGRQAHPGGLAALAAARGMWGRLAAAFSIASHFRRLPHL